MSSDRQLAPERQLKTHLLAVIQAEGKLALEHAKHIQALSCIQLQQQLRLAKRCVDTQHVDCQLSLVEEVSVGSKARDAGGWQVGSTLMPDQELHVVAVLNYSRGQERHMACKVGLTTPLQI
jgi:hypothetical protein